MIIKYVVNVSRSIKNQMNLPDWLIKEQEDRKVKRRKHIRSILIKEGIDDKENLK